MHEYHLAQSVVKSVIDKTKDLSGIKGISRIVVTVGELKMVTAESFRNAFEEAARGTLCEGAQLEVSIVAGDTLSVDHIEADFQEES